MKYELLEQTYFEDIGQRLPLIHGYGLLAVELMRSLPWELVIVGWQLIRAANEHHTLDIII